MIHIEDLNLPLPDAHGTQPVLELIRQVIDRGGWYALSDPEYASLEPVYALLEDVCVVSAMPALMETTRAAVPPRLARHMYVVHVCSISEADMRAIFTYTLRWYHAMSFFPDSIMSLQQQIIDASLAVYRCGDCECLCMPAILNCVKKKTPFYAKTNACKKSSVSSRAQVHILSQSTRRFRRRDHSVKAKLIVCAMHSLMEREDGKSRGSERAYVLTGQCTETRTQERARAVAADPCEPPLHVQHARHDAGARGHAHADRARPGLEHRLGGG